MARRPRQEWVRTARLANPADDTPGEPHHADGPQDAANRGSVDARGRALHRTEAKARARAEEAIRALDALGDMGDEDEQRATLDALRKALNEEPMSDRPRFRPGGSSSSMPGRSG